MTKSQKIFLPVIIGGAVVIVSLSVKELLLDNGIENGTIPIPGEVINIYKDGTYSAVGTYNTPGGEERINVTLTIKNSFIAKVVASGVSPSSKKTTEYQNYFSQGISSYIVGRKVDKIYANGKVSGASRRVSGSSLTIDGFNQALGKIRILAK